MPSSHRRDPGSIPGHSSGISTGKGFGPSYSIFVSSVTPPVLHIADDIES